MNDEALTDAQRFPGISERGRSTLNWMREHPHAPRWNHHCGDRLDDEARNRVREYESRLFSARESWSTRLLPIWVEEYARWCINEVPIYRRENFGAQNFFDCKTTSRTDLAREPWGFVPDAQSLDNLILYATGGTTGEPIEILAHPEFSAKYLPLLKLALQKRGVEIDEKELQARRISQVLVCYQQSTFTFATIASYWNESGFIKLNLAESEWRAAADRAAFLNECDPLLIGGDPISLSQLLQLKGLQIRPRALVSTAMTLSSALQNQLQEYFGCAVIELYSMNESGPLAVRISENEWEILPHDVFVEVLDADGNPSARGEVVLTGGRNPFLPLFRYRTGDWAELENRETAHGTIQILKNFEGRTPVAFQSATGNFVNNIDVTDAVRVFPISQWSLHQNSDGSLLFKMRGASTPAHTGLLCALKNLFGDLKIEVEELNPQSASGKVLCYTSDLSVGAKRASPCAE